MTEFETVFLAAALVIGAGQIAIVWYGIRAIRRAGEHRAREQDQRHTETMRAHADQHRALKALISGMKSVIERTAPAPGRSFSERRATTSGQINTRIIAMRVSENDAREILSRIEHEKCSQGINGHWSMYRGRFYGDTNGTNQPSAQSIC